MGTVWGEVGGDAAGTASIILTICYFEILKKERELKRF